MVNDDLRSYLREGVRRGYTPEVLSQELIKIGWDSNDVSLAVHELSVVENAIAQETKPETVTPTVSPQFDNAQDSSNRKTVVIVLGVVLFLLIAFGAAAGYFFMLKKEDPLPEFVLANMQRAMKDVHSYAFDTKIDINLVAVPEGELLFAANSYIGKGAQGELKLNTTATGTVVMGETATTSQVDVIYRVDGNASFGAISVKLDGSANLRVINGLVYIRVIQFPQLLTMYKTDNSFEEWKDKWIVIDPKSPSLINSSELAAKDSSTPISPLSLEDREKMQQIVTKNWPLELSAIDEKEAPLINGKKMYHYKYSLNRAKLSSLFTEIVAESQVNQRNIADPAALKEGIEALVGVIASSTGELFIGKDDSLLYRMSMHLPVNVSTSSVRLSGAVSIVFEGSQFNAVPPIAIPDAATSFEDVSKNIMGKSMDEARMKSRDAKRISDIGQIQLGLELYFDAHQKYPTSLSPLVAEHFLPIMPTDPTDPTKYNQYAYQQLKNGKAYALGASLENAKNTVLELDTDVNENIVRGNDGTGCRGENGRYCYDIAPY